MPRKRLSKSGKGLADNLKNNLKALGNTVKKNVAEAGKGISANLQKGVEELKTKASEVGKGISADLQQGVEKAELAASGFADNVGSAVSNVPSSLMAQQGPSDSSEVVELRNNLDKTLGGIRDSPYASQSVAGGKQKRRAKSKSKSKSKSRSRSRSKGRKGKK